MPYLSFQGNCEEALQFYSAILDGQVEIVSRYDNPAMNAPEDFRNKILHARLAFGNHVLFASDVMPKKQGEPMTGGNIAISLGLNWLMMIYFGAKLRRFKIWLYPLMFVVNPFFNWYYMVYGKSSEISERGCSLSNPFQHLKVQCTDVF